MKTEIYVVPPTNSLNEALWAWRILLAACFMLTTKVLALDPPPAGGYPGEITALGENALFNQTQDTNVENTAIGFEALYTNTLGGGDTAVGASALHDNISGDGNTAIGSLALTKNITGSSNTAVGDAALRYNTVGLSNTALGTQALGLSDGDGNTAVGDGAMFFNTSGSYNTSLGVNTLAFTTTGTRNVALGYAALNLNTTGSFNIGIGPVGGSQVSTGSHNIEIGNQGKADDNRVIRIGETRTQKNTYIAGISGVTVAGGVGVIIDTNGHLGTVSSSARYKEAIKPMEKSSEAILSLKPVSFRYKYDLDPQGIPQFGLVAEDVAKVDPNLVARDEEGKPYTVRYEAVNAMLLNEFLKEHRKVEEQGSEIAELKAKVDRLEQALTDR